MKTININIALCTRIHFGIQIFIHQLFFVDVVHVRGDAHCWHKAHTYTLTRTRAHAPAEHLWSRNLHTPDFIFRGLHFLKGRPETEHCDGEDDGEKRPHLIRFSVIIMRLLFNVDTHLQMACIININMLLSFWLAALRERFFIARLIVFNSVFSFCLLEADILSSVQVHVGFIGAQRHYLCVKYLNVL